jgi:hypothetical protein
MKAAAIQMAEKKVWAHIGLAGLALRVERVEFEVEIMLARLPGIDRAALGFWNDRLHDLCSPSPREGRAEAAFPLGRPMATARRDLLLAARAGVRPLGDIAISLSIRRPKKRGPFQAVPVMARAIVDRLA